jgi:hypothetical protein
MGDHIVIFGLTEVRILGDRPTEVYDSENAAISLIPVTSIHGNYFDVSAEARLCLLHVHSQC